MPIEEEGVYLQFDLYWRNISEVSRLHFLKANPDVFAWSPSNMLSISIKIIAQQSTYSSNQYGKKKMTMLGEAANY